LSSVLNTPPQTARRQFYVLRAPLQETIIGEETTGIGSPDVKPDTDVRPDSGGWQAKGIDRLSMWPPRSFARKGFRAVTGLTTSTGTGSGAYIASRTLMEELVATIRSSPLLRSRFLPIRKQGRRAHSLLCWHPEFCDDDEKYRQRTDWPIRTRSPTFRPPGIWHHLKVATNPRQTRNALFIRDRSPANLFLLKIIPANDSGPR